MSRITAFALMVLLFLLSSAFFPVHSCPPHERRALSRFRSHVYDSEGGALLTWEGDDCCAWRGVECNGTQEGRHVSKLNLKYFALENYEEGTCPYFKYLVKLKHLVYLDLSYNFLGGEMLGNLSSLRRLDLSGNSKFTSSNLHWLSNLSSLEYLALNFVIVSDKSWASIIGSLLHLKHLDLFMSFSIDADNSISNIQTLGKLSSLTYLDLSSNRLLGSIPNTIAKLSSLTYLDLSRNQISGSIPHSIGNLFSLTHLDLSDNNISRSIPNTVGNLSYLTHLDLSFNNVSGRIPNTIGNLSNLEHLDLSYNALVGSLPLSFSELFSLSVLDVSCNQLSGSLPLSFAHLSSLNARNNHLNGSIPSALMLPSSLQRLVLSDNIMTGAITEVFFQIYLKLKLLDLSQSGLSINISSTWIPSFQLRALLLKKCQIGGPIPSWISTQFSLSVLDLSATQVTGNLPSWLWDMDIDEVYLSDNHLQGCFTPTSGALRNLDLSMNEFMGGLPADIHILLSKAEVLRLADNKFEGQIPSTIANLTYLRLLDVSNNSLTGNVPATLGKLTSLQGLHLENNCLEGEIPKELGNFSSDFRSLRIGKNSLHGFLPSSLRNLSNLQVLDVGENNLIGSIPHWIANFSSLHVLVMRSNHFRGRLPPAIGQMPMLQVLDLSSNLFSGTIPHSYLRFPAMQNSSDDGSHLSIFSSAGSHSDGNEVMFYHVKNIYLTDSETDRVTEYGYSYNYDLGDSMDLTIKGLGLHYEHILSSFTSIDLSNNRLTGHLLPEIESLQGLRYLDLSMNNLSGPIPKSLGHLVQLESLDLSVNHFSGQIPGELGNISSLAHLNLSFNQLHGRIPQQGGQMLTFDESCFRGNPNLWGCPLERTCFRLAARASPPPAVSVEEKSAEGFEFPWFWMCFGLSWGVGFSTVVLVLEFKLSWRTKCFQVMDRMICNLPKPVWG